MTPFLGILLFIVSTLYAEESVDQPSLNIPDTRNTVLIALSTYCGNRLVNKSWSCYWCSQIPGFQFVASWNNANTNIFGFTGIRDNTVYVVWRGTVLLDIKNWVKNFEFKKVNYPGVDGAQVHSGFFSEYNSVKDDSLRAVSQAISMCPKCRVMVSGHSLGGALSVLSALDVKKISNRTVLVSLSSPRVGNMAFKNYAERFLATPRWRVVNSADVVPHVPPELFGFQHVGGEAWQRSNGNWQFCDSGESSNCSNSLTPFFNPLDHAHIMGFDLLKGVNAGCLVDANNKNSMNIGFTSDLYLP